MATRWPLALLATALLLSGTARAAPLCVDAEALPGVGDGTCWDAPFARIQEAVNAAAAAGGGEVWVRAGVYFENPRIGDGVAVYGGFAGGETALEERDFASNVTVIDGGRVATAVGISGGPSTRLDGFTVRNGYASRDRSPGGGVSVSGQVIVANNWITGNESGGWGGGLLALEAGSPLVTGNVIENNRSVGQGGGIWDVMSGTRIVGNVIRNNSPAGITIWASSPTVANNVVLGNGISQIDPNSSIRTGWIVNNLSDCIGVSASWAGAVANNVIRCGSALSVASLPRATIRANAYWNAGKPVSGLVAGDGNLLLDCQPNSLVLAGGFHLSPGSPCVDRGDATLLPPTLATDRDGEPRVMGAAVDLGPDETGLPHTTLQASGTPGAIGWFLSDVTVALSAGPAGAVAATELSTDGGASWAPYAGPLAFSAEGVPTWLGYRSVGTDGAVEAAKYALVRLDKTPPVTAAAIDGHRLGQFFDVAPTVTLTASDAEPGSGVDLVTVSDGCTLYQVPYRAPFAWSCDGNPAVLTYQTRDRAGNAATGRLEAPVDVVPPATSISLVPYYGYQGWWNTDVTATVFSYNPGSGVSTRETSLDGGPWLPYSDAAPIIFSAEGAHVLRARGWDGLGRVGPETAVAISVDRTPPTTTVSLGGTGADGCFRSDVDAVITAADALSGIYNTEYSVDGGTTWNWTYSGIPNRVSAEGTTTFLHRARDIAQNYGTPGQVEIRIDRVAPVTTATVTGAPGLGGWLTSPAQVTLVATDAGCGVRSTSYRIGDGPWQDWAGTPIAVAGDGPTTVAFRSVDAPGNAEPEQQVSFQVDATPPTCAVSLSGAPGAPPWFVSPVVATVAASDAQPGSGLAAVEVSVDGGPWAPHAGPVVLATEGVHAVACRATDAAGNVGAPAQASVPVDLAPPATAAEVGGTPGENGWLVSPATVTLSATDAASGVAATEWSEGGLLWYPYAPPLAFGDGCRTVSFRSTDRAGWTESPGGEVAFCVDTTPPAVASTAPPNGAPPPTVPIGTSIALTFTESVVPGPAFGAIAVTATTGRRVLPVAFTATVSGATLVLRPTAPLPRNATIDVAAPAGAVKDPAGNPGALHAFRFQTSSR